MGFRLPRIVKAKILKRTLLFLETTVVPKGHFVVYVGEIDEKKRFIALISFLNHHFFQILLSEVKEEYGFNHPMGALTICYSEEAFHDPIGCLQSS
ncbi:hypothetical protein Goari_016959 [Gossypium aridum]|uniref:Uncharacterized protein n=1 Tax=Gossypium aridum TaxID=34290 RepID=A0A7J8WKD6_GOSAI|nr:hypothetical protein [Gossypium aridum]